MSITAACITAAGITIEGHTVVLVDPCTPIRYIDVHCRFYGGWNGQHTKLITVRARGQQVLAVSAVCSVCSWGVIL